MAPSGPPPLDDLTSAILPAEDLSGVLEAPDLDEHLVGTVVAGRYTVTRLVGSGGMGCVYQAFDAARQTNVALKVLKHERMGSSENVQRFMQEARVLSMLSHPTIVELLDYGQDDNEVLYLAMELLEGTDLAQYLSSHRRLPWAEVNAIAAQLVQGLGLAHQHGIIHRDLKPENVFLVPGRPGGPHQVKLLDFGIAKVQATGQGNLTAAGAVFGTARYMSPEHASGTSVDARSDVYGVGILMYEMLTGNPPFTGDDFMRTAHQHVSDPPKPLSEAAPDVVILPVVEELVMRALAKSKDDRFGSMADFGAALEASTFDGDSTMAMVRPQLPDPPKRRSVPPPIPAPPRPEATVIRSAPTSSPPGPNPAEQTVIRRSPFAPASSTPPHQSHDPDRTVIRSIPSSVRPPSQRTGTVPPNAPPADATVIVRRPDPIAVGGTMVVQSPQAPESLPPRPASDPGPALPPRPSRDGSVPPPTLDPAPMSATSAGFTPPPADFAASAPIVPPPGATMPPSIAPPPSGVAPFASGPSVFPAAHAPQFPPSAAEANLAPLRNDAGPVFAKEQNAALMHAQLAPQRLSPNAPHPADANLSQHDFNHEQALQTPYGGPWTQDPSAAPDPSDDLTNAAAGDMLLRPPDRELSRNVVVAIIIVSVLSLATIAFVAWTMLRDEPDHSVSEPHPATMTEQPRPMVFEPPVIQGPKFPDNEPDEVVPEPAQPPPSAPARPAKVAQNLTSAQIDDGFSRASSAIAECARTQGAIKGSRLKVSFDVLDRRARNTRAQPPHHLTPLGKCIEAAVNTHASFANSSAPSMAIARTISF